MAWKSGSLKLATTVARIVGYEGRIENDYTKPDGTPRKLMDVSKLNGFGWNASIDFESGIKGAYADFLMRFES